MASIDVYNIKAQPSPIILIGVLPAISVAFLFPEMSWKTAAVPSTVMVALTLVAAAFSRDQGKRREPKLHQHWGGKPTTVMLRYRSKTFPEKQLSNLHRFLAKITHNTIPAAKREESDPADADVVYESLTRYLRDSTRDKKAYPFVFRELVHYGFLRNLWGLRSTAITFAILTLIGTCAWLKFSGPLTLDIRGVAPALNVVAIIIWLCWPDRTAVRHAAESYATSLIGAGFKMAEADVIEEKTAVAVDK